MKNKIIKIVKWYLIIHIAVSSVLLIDYTFFVKESTKITWEGRSYPITRVRDKDCVKNRVKRAKIVRFTLC